MDDAQFIQLFVAGESTRLGCLRQSTQRSEYDRIRRHRTLNGCGLSCVQCYYPLIRTALERLSGNYAYTHQYYDSSGRVERVSEAYFYGQGSD